MNTPDDDPELAALFAPLDADLPPPHRGLLDTLRERTTTAFAAETSPRTPAMKLSAFRWIAAVAAMLVVGVVTAQWIVRMNRIAVVPPPDDDKFAFTSKLTDDGRIGKVAESQGVVCVRPVMAERWSPVQPRLVLKPGDWIRTDARGANAASLKLLPGTGVIVGPHSMVELTKADEIRLVTGEIEVAAAKDAPVRLLGPNKQSLKVEGTQFVRIEKEKLVVVAQEPLWLKGFKGTAANETVGSLIATVDGRAVPLTVGYHHVTVDIRDQIARTVIEESFVNTTHSVLEGVFYFPLPQDASISGFGMWIGNQLVEADVVEKERAREIYETILRERRDPGLLEWAGGNIFKARVYPIPAHSEKRIKISYTQVLPRTGNRYRYSYGLQSELLKQHPLRDLKIDLTVNSAVPLKGVTSPTHDTRLSVTEHSGHVEFAAQEYTPTRDFEAVIEVAGRTSDVVVIPHRRGEDGYFMVQLTPPGTAGDWERPLIPNGEPLKLLVLADTSASMDRGQRANQNALIASLLSALTPKDTINVAAFDVNCDWVFEKPVPATPQNIAAIRDTLSKRVSLGWTNLDKAFASALAMCEPGTHAVYLGDGISTNTDADPVAFAKRLTNLGQAKPGTFHAVALGSSSEPAAMKAIASLGGGSLRRVTGEQGPQTVAAELLTEIATPTLRNLKVEIHGVRTARVYPEELPNVAAGSQQILLGRYLPEGKDQHGEIVVTGTLSGKPIRFVSKFDLKDAEQGNSFIPRLWARMHLDKLLEQGTSETIKQDIIALSEEFNIITPYTSLLVLESDADRERFAVKRRFQMRDGEKFFAEGRDNATFELKQKQMRLAGDYRTALRRKVLGQLQSLGRDARMFQAPRQPPNYGLLGEKTYSGTEWFSDNAPIVIGGSVINESLGVSDSSVWDRQKFNVEDDFRSKELNDLAMSTTGFDAPSEPGSPSPYGLNPSAPAATSTLPVLKAADREEDLPMFTGRGTVDGLGYENDVKLLAGITPLGNSYGEFESPAGGFGGGGWGGRADPTNHYFRYSTTRSPATPLPWLTAYFPQLPPPAREWKEPKTQWPAEAIALSKSLLRSEKLAKQQGGLVIARTTETFDARNNAMTSRSERTELVSPGSWLSRSTPDTGPTMIGWCDARERGAINTAYQLGRVRTSNAHDLQRPDLQLADESMAPLHSSHANHTAKVEAIGKDRALLTLRDPRYAQYETRYLIDTARHVVLSVEQLYKGKTSAITKFAEFAEFAGTWWARKVESFDDKGRRTLLAVQKIEEATAEAFAMRFGTELDARKGVLILKQPLPKIAEAKAAVVAKKETLEDRAVLVLHFAATQQWTLAQEHLTAFEQLSKDSALRARRVLVNAYLLSSRKHEELRKELLKEAEILAKGDESLPNRYYLAQRLHEVGSQVLQADEMLALSSVLVKVHRDQPAYLLAYKAWRNQRVYLLQNAGQAEQALALSKELATEYPQDAHLQNQHAQRLVGTGDYEAAYAWIDAAVKRDLTLDEADMLRGQYSEFLRNQGRFKELVAYSEKRFTLKPDAEPTYGVYLSALIRSNEAAKAEKLTAQWLKEGRVDGELPRPVLARLNAAVAFALGQTYYFNTNRIDDQWLQPLADTALFFAPRDDDSQIADTILNQWRYQRTDEAKVVRKTLAAELMKNVAAWPMERIARSMNWAWGDAGLENADWKKLAAELRKRWDAEKDEDAKHRIGESLIRILDRFGGEERLSFLRTSWKGASETYRRQYAHRLFDALLAHPWTPAIEDEAFTVLGDLAGPDEPASGLRSRVAGLYRLTDTMVEARYQAAFTKVERPDKLTRPELQKKQAELRKQAREGFADRLKAEAARRAKPFANWLTIERLWLETILDRNLKAVATDAWAILDAPVLEGDPSPDDLNAKIEGAFDGVLRDRALMTLTNLAARKGADAALVERLLKYIDSRIANPPDELRWKAEKYRVLIALDRPKELEVELRKWIALPDASTRWMLALGYLLAEQGQLPEAINLFKVVEAADELSPQDYRSLADWYVIQNRREESEKARAALYKATDENTLARRVGVYLRPWQSTHLPTRLDPEVLEVFKVLFEKSTWPANYLGMLQQFYQASRDFRLLSMLPDGVVGHTAGKVYPFLQRMHGVLGEVRDEATADELVARIGRVRLDAKSPVDHRALDLLEALVERRAAELLNQPGPHVEKCLVALERAFERKWSPGEPRMMADFLAGLGSISRSELRAEQRRELELLYRDAKAGSFDRLHIALQYAATLDGAAQHQPALDVLEAALREFETAHGGKLPTEANDALARFISFTENARQFERGERALLAQLKHPIHAQQGFWLVRRLDQLYREALLHGGEVSLGKGAVLYKALEKKLFADLATNDLNQRYALFGLIVRVYRTAFDLKIEGGAADLKAFAFDRLPPMLMVQATNYDDVVRDVANAVHDLVAPRDGIAFLLDRVEREPDWMRYNNQNVWSQYSDRLGEWRHEVKELGDLEPRFLKYVLAELRRDLRSREAWNRTLYHRNHNYYWAEKAADFAKVAEEVYAERKASAATVEYIAEYLFHGLQKEQRAIEILFAAHNEKLLGESGEWRLVDYLHRTKRYAESIPLLLSLIERHPDNLGYRTKLMHAYYQTAKTPELLTLLKQTDAMFHEKDRWNEGIIAALAYSCLENKLFADSVRYYEELIPLYQRLHPSHRGDDTLSWYYTHAADAYAGLNRTKEAVDRASAAVVLWPASHHRRKELLDHLVAILEAAPKLDEYIAVLDKEPLQSAVIRKSIGRALMKKNEHARAVPQLKLAVELQPNDAELYELLVTCFDKIGDGEGAVRQLLEAVELSRREIKLYEQLGTRLAAANRSVEAERAFTSTVEMLPNESESHTALAETYEKQNRWPEAIGQWRRVVQIRSLEPTGLLRLAAAQIHEGQWEKASETLRRLRTRTWPARFLDVEKQTSNLERQIDTRKQGDSPLK